MVNRDEHWNDILGIAKSSKLANQPAVTELDSQSKAQLDATVHAHIDQQFNVAKNEHVEITNGVATSNQELEDKPSILGWLTEQLNQIGRVPALALVAVFAISFSLFTGTRNSADPFSDVPESLYKADLGTQLTLTNSGQRALSTSTSQRRNAFVSGTIKADLDVVRGADNNAMLNIINRYSEFFGDNASATEQDRLAAFEKQTESLLEDDNTKQWLKEGYLIELTRLAALSALNTAQVAPLNDAIQYLNQSTDLKTSITNSDGIDTNYISDRNEITESRLIENFAPDDIQRIIDLTQNLQVLVE